MSQQETFNHFSAETQKEKVSDRESVSISPELWQEIRQVILANRQAVAVSDSARETEKLGAHLWDEIAKAIAQKMQDQLIPVVNFIYCKNYPLDVKIDFLSTEYATRRKRPGHPAPLVLTDITFRIDGREIYHLEFQIERDGNISIRMLEYDFQIALQHDSGAAETGSVTAVTFPHSAVIYPAGGKNLPEYLDCELRFPDGTSHSYRVPTVDISKYELKELFGKQLNMFLPFSLLRFSDRLDHLKKLRKELEEAVRAYEDRYSAGSDQTKQEDSLDGGAGILKTYDRYRKCEASLKKDLTTFLNELILGLETEFDQEIITKQHYDDYVRLVYYALERILHSHPALRKEASKVTESKIKLVSEIMREKDEALAEKDEALAEKDAALSEKEAALLEKDAEILALKRQLAELQEKK